MSGFSLKFIEKKRSSCSRSSNSSILLKA